MCGIAGWLQGPDQREGDMFAARLQAMNDGIAHRGPDANNIWLDGGIGLCHRRLSIIDLSSNNDQPLHDSNGRYVIVFNGEIYNYVELRAELEATGAVFRTAGDTEVVLEAYSRWGSDCLNRFLGMFAFAIWDRQEKALFLARDPVGKKPLFYADMAGHGVAFASEPAALLKNPRVDPTRNDSAMRKFLVLGYTTGSDTVWKGIERLLPAHAMRVRQGQPAQIFCYKNLVQAYQTKRQISETEAAGEFNRILDDASRIRCRADVPYGIFLSGGLDSNAVLASTVRAIGTGNTRSFSIGFSEAEYDESHLAERSAAHFGTQHKTFHLNPAKTDFDAIFSRMGAEPLADISFIPTYQLARETRRDVKMVLTGDGGDELFAGYPTYVADRLRRRVRWMLPDAAWGAAYKLADRTLPGSQKRMSLAFKLRQFLRGVNLDEGRAHFAWRLTTPENAWRDLFSSGFAEGFSWDEVYADFDRHHQAAKSLTPLDRALYVDMKTWLVDGVMVKADRATMASGLEARSPLLDIRMVEFAASLPDHMKLDARNIKKKILRVAQKDRLPEFILSQKKRGFSVPVSAWLKHEMRGMMTDALNDPALDPYFDRAKLSELYNRHRAGRVNAALPLFNTLVFSRWLKQSGLAS